MCCCCRHRCCNYQSRCHLSPLTTRFHFDCWPSLNCCSYLHYCWQYSYDLGADYRWKWLSFHCHCCWTCLPQRQQPTVLHSDKIGNFPWWSGNWCHCYPCRNYYCSIPIPSFDFSFSSLLFGFLNFPQNFFNSQKRIRGFLLLLLLFDLITRSFSNFSIASAYRFTITKFLRVSMFNTLLKTDLLYVSGFHDFVAKLIRIVLIVGIVFNMMIVWMRKKQLYKMKTDIQLALIGLCQVQWFVFERLHCQR